MYSVSIITIYKEMLLTLPTNDSKKYRMVNMKEIDNIINIIRSIDGFNSVDFIILYGSFSNGTSRECSDIDICVHHTGNEDDRSDFRFRVLSALMDDDIDVHIYQDLPLFIRKDIFKGKILFCRDEIKINDLAYREMREFEDFAPRYHDYIGMEALG